MEKTLIFLKDLLVKTRLDEEIVSEHIIFDISESIAELEALQYRSCEECAHHRGKDKTEFCILKFLPAHVYGFQFYCSKHKGK